MKLNRAKMPKYILPIGIPVGVVFCGIVLSMPLFAVGDAGNDGGNSASNPTNCNTQTVGSCHGGGWTYHQWPAGQEGDIVIPGMSGSGYNFQGGVISAECKDVGGYWRSSWFRNGSNSNLVGMAPNNTWAPIGAGGWHTYNANATPLDTVRKAYEIAEANGDVPAGVDWNNVSWFCSSGDTDDDPDPVTGSTSFYSTSTVKINDPDISGGKTVTTKKDGEATVKFSTDEPSITVEFSHTVGYDHGSFTMNSEDTTSGGAVTTNWKVSGAYSVGSTSWGALRPDSDHTTTPDTAKKSITIDLAPGETKTKCSTINYDRKKASLTGKWVCDERVCGLFGCSCVRGHYNYTATYSDKGSSKVCVEVTRPDAPTPSDGGPENPGGDTNSKIMFAGEDTSLLWNGISAKSYTTRRLSGWQSIKFQVAHNIPYEPTDKFQKDTNSKSDPCTMYKSRFSITNNDLCKVHESGSWNTASSSTHSHSYGGGSVEAKVKVPDYVGDKYCNSFGYSFEYWYIIEGSANESDNGEHHDTPKDYWYNFGAACRTIAKKPTTAAWNGSIMTMGNISTSLASRHNSIVFGDAANNDRTLYGSWSEYLVVANASLNSSRTMASGSSLSEGSANLKLCDGQPWSSNSSLTISNFSGSDTNVCQLTPSGITSNTTFMTRLNAYLRDVENNPNITKTNNISDLYGGVQGNTVLNVNGDLKIEQNITISDSTSYSIHNVPQAIIFVNNGNVDISENVDRIDAWLIVTGTKSGNTGIINTCAGFTPGTNVDVTSDGAGFSGNRCTKQLAFNGPVIARKMNLQRSYGSDPLISRTGTFGTSSYKETPAEIFNLRADSYLWAYAQAARYGSSYSEAYSRELAPRF